MLWGADATQGPPEALRGQPGASPRDLQAQGADTAAGKILGTQSSLPSRLPALRQEQSSELRGQGSRPSSAAQTPCDISGHSSAALGLPGSRDRHGDL